MSEAAELLALLRQHGALPHRYQGREMFGPRPDSDIVTVPLGLLDRLAAYVEADAPAQRGRRPGDVSHWAEMIVEALSWFSSPSKAELLAVVQRETGWPKAKMKSLETIVNRRLRATK